MLGLQLGIKVGDGLRLEFGAWVRVGGRFGVGVMGLESCLKTNK